MVGLMLLLAAVLVATVSNLDNLAAGFAFGVRGTRIAMTPNLIIAVITMAGTAAAMTSGHALSHLLAPTVASALGASIIIAIGARTILGSLGIRRRLGRRQSLSGQGLAEEASLESVPAMRGEVKPANAVGVGIALALNNVGTGIGAGVARLSPVATTFLAGAISLLSVGGGSKAGTVLGQLGRAGPAQRMSGLILLGLGTAMLTGLG
jgi:putative sporulation protein YtaF